MHYTSINSFDPPSFICALTERMDDWSPLDSRKRITCIMMIHAGHQNKEILDAALCSLITEGKHSSMN